MKTKNLLIAPAVLLSITTLSFLILSSTITHADGNTSTTDTLNITVNSACTMMGGTNGDSTSDNTFTATIDPSTYQEFTGSKLTTLCNDKDGYAIYAIGYSGNSYDAPDNTKLLGQGTIAGTNINTGTSGDNSYWAMKLTSVSGTTPPTILNNFNNYHVIPETYTAIAKHTTNTSSSTSAGATIQTNYKVNIGSSQIAGSYQGKVKYTMVHPNDANAPAIPRMVTITYDGNGETFQGGATTNEVIYTGLPMYIANTPQIAKLSNVTDLENYTPYTLNTYEIIPVTSAIPGASKMKVVVNYGLDTNAGIYIIEGNWDGSYVPSNYETLIGQASGTATYTFDGDAVTFYFDSYGEDAPTSGYDLGFYAEVYPIYATEQTGTSPLSDYATISTETGTYATTTNWYGSWYTDINNEHYDFTDENDVTTFLGENISTLSGQTITLNRGLTFTEAYTRAGKSQSGGYYTQQDLNESMCHTIAIHQNQTLKDTRDNNTYLVGKLKGGSCWMLDNMALDLTDSTTLANVTEQTTNASTTTLNYLKNGGGTTSDRYAINPVVEWANSPNYASSSSYSDPLIVTSGNCQSTSECANDPESGKWTKDSVVTHYGIGSGKIGIYYNYCAVSAGSYCYGDGHSTPGSPSGDSTEDICPKNWRMPAGTTGAMEYKKLFQKYTTDYDNNNSPTSLQYNLSVTLSGIGDGDDAGTQNLTGQFWSSSFTNEEYMDYLRVYYGASIGDGDKRLGGRSLRCVVGD